MADTGSRRPALRAPNGQDGAAIVTAASGEIVPPAEQGTMTLGHLQKLALAELALRGPKGFIGGGGPVVTTRDALPRPFVEVALLYGQAVGGTRPIELALTNLQDMGRDHKCDAVVSVELLEYEAKVGTVIVAYGTGIRYLDVPRP